MFDKKIGFVQVVDNMVRYDIWLKSIEHNGVRIA